MAGRVVVPQMTQEIEGLLERVERGEILGPKRIDKKFRVLLDLYVGDALLDVGQAAEGAGYKFPKVAGARMRRQWPELFDRVELALREHLVVQGQELLERIASLVRDPRHKDHFKAIELQAKLLGLLNDKGITISINKAEFGVSLAQAMTNIAIARAPIQLHKSTQATGDTQQATE